MKKIIIILAVVSLGIVSSTYLPAQPQAKIVVKEKISIEVINGVKPPNSKESELMREEERTHPNIIKAIFEVKAAIKALNDAPENFGGHKKEAIQDLEKSYISLRKALYYRLWEDTH